MTRPTVPSDCVIYACNRDGLGERLRAMMNAVRLAEYLDRSYVLSWPPLREQLAGQHAIIDYREFLSDDAVATRHIDVEAMKGRTVLSATKAFDMVSSGDPLPDGCVINVNQTKISNQWPGAEQGSSSYRDTFDALPLSPQFKAVCARAFEVPMPASTAAIHLRAGDIVYGMYRTMDDFHGKVLSYPLAEELARRVAADGLTPVFFGQDDDLLAYLADLSGGVVADSLIDKTGMTRTEAALTDMCLMSRNSRIYAGTSGFAVIAAWLGGINTTPPNKVFEPAVAVDLISAAILDTATTDDRVSDLQKAFAARAALVVGGADLPRDDRERRLMQTAWDLDRENDFYGLVMAADAYADARPGDGEAILLDVIRANNRRLRPFLQNNGKPGTAVKAEPYTRVIAPYAEQGYPMACLCMALAVVEGSPEFDRLVSRYLERPVPGLQPVLNRLFRGTIKSQV